jgi:predicted metal-binding membrane protein
MVAGLATALAGFALSAATVQRVLELRGMVSPSGMQVTHPLLAGGILVAVGMFQFSKLKLKALMHCRGFARRRPPAGDFGTGLRYGGCCLVWCGPIFLLLFFAGVMNLYWLAILMAGVVVERLVPRGDSMGLGAGGVLMLWGLLFLISATGIL